MAGIRPVKQRNMTAGKRRRAQSPMGRSLALIWSVSKSRTIATLVAGGLMAVASLAVYLIVYRAIAAVLDPAAAAGPEALAGYGALLMAAIIARYALIALAFTLSHQLAYAAQSQLRQALLAKLARVPMDFFTWRNPQDIRNIVIEDVGSLEDGMAHLTPRLAAAMLGSLAILSALLLVNWRLALASVAPIILGLLVMALTLGRGGDTIAQYHELQQRMASQSWDLIKGMPTVRVYNTAAAITERLERMFDQIRQMAAQWMRRMALPTAIYQVLIGAALLFVLPLAVWLYTRGEADAATLVFFAIFALLFVESLKAFYDLSYRAHEQTAAFSRIDRLLDAAEISQSQNSGPPRDSGLSFANVSLSYGARRALEDLSLSIRPGERVALVGPSGAGKSTLARLAARFMDPDQGTVAMGGVDLKALDPRVLSASFSCLFQDPCLFADTIEANIRMGKQAATRDEIEQAAKAANAHDFITALPDGYRTTLGEATRLSGGEAQRLALARVFLRDAPLLILDEATTHADAENETRLQQAVGRLGRGKTMLVIAHRLSTIIDMDRIVVMDQGKILAQGRHGELLKRCALYRRMWDQFRTTRLFRYSTGPALAARANTGLMP